MTAADLGILVLRIVVGLLFAGHGAQKAFGWWSGPGFEGWTGAMERMNLRPTTLWATVSMLAELVGGLLFAVGLLTPLAAAVIVAQVIAIIGYVHLPKGLWNTRGGFEYPLVLGAVAVAVLATGPGSVSLDAALKLSWSDTVRLVLLVLGIVAGLIAVAVPRLQSRDLATPQTR